MGSTIKEKRKKARKIQTEYINNFNKHGKFEPSRYTRKDIQKSRKIPVNPLRDPDTGL